MIPKRLWLMPILGAIYWGSCRGVDHERVSPAEVSALDVRFAICALVLGVSSLVLISAFIPGDE